MLVLYNQAQFAFLSPIPFSGIFCHVKLFGVFFRFIEAFKKLYPAMGK